MGFSGSGKTYFIENAIKLLKEKLNYNVSVIKNIYHHQIDEAGKDSYKFSEAGAHCVITRNIFNETTIFMKKEIDMEQLIDWFSKYPFVSDLVFFEGFRTLNYPSIICVKDLEEIEAQLLKDPHLSKVIKMISGLICTKKSLKEKYLDLPIIDIKKDFKSFLEIFNIKKNSN
ncbi:MAG: molybdopterin-guanine dinucleotide biosynthesis protein B [Promethearchaeota archaeon]